MADAKTLKQFQEIIKALGIKASDLPNLFAQEKDLKEPPQTLGIGQAEAPYTPTSTGYIPFDPEQARRDFNPTTPNVIVDTRPLAQRETATTADPMEAAKKYDAMVANRNAAARAAVLGRIRQQQESGVRSYAPADATAATEEIRRRLAMTEGGQARAVPAAMFTAPVETIQQMPTGGVVADFGGGNRVVTSRYGTGYINPRGTPGKGTIEGIPAAQWFQEAANRQNQMVDMGVGKDLYILEGRKAEFAEGTRRLKAAESAASKAKKA